MPYSACDGCHRLFAIDTPMESGSTCPNCGIPLRPVTAEEGQERFRSLTWKRCADQHSQADR